MQQQTGLAQRALNLQKIGILPEDSLEEDLTRIAGITSNKFSTQL
ncbi:MAG: hypothetical protein AAGA76_02875 [Pseudomonadota bacterium]